MRIPDFVRKCVVFLGLKTFSASGEEEFDPFGTGFWVKYREVYYLLTCRHVAKLLDGSPMGIRCNTREGTADVYEVERAQWLYHPDDSVDLAAWQGGIPSTFDWFTLDEDMIVARDALTTWDVGAGDLAYAIGLFRLLVGNRRNLTIVHSGNIAMIPGDEKIPVWDKHLGRSVETVGYLVELGSLEGLSGAPVFARRTFRFGGKPDDGFSAGLLPSSIFLLGVWQGMWTGISDRNVVAAGPVDGSKPIVPVGVGVVVPSDKIRELLDIASATQPSG